MVMIGRTKDGEIIVRVQKIPKEPDWDDLYEAHRDEVREEAIRNGTLKSKERRDCEY